MVTKSRLRSALAAEKGVDFKKLKQEKKRKEAEKAKKAAAAPGEYEEIEIVEEDNVDEDDEEAEEEETGTLGRNLEAVDESDSDSSIDFEDRIPRKKKTGNAGKKDDDDEEEEEEDDDDDEEEEEEDDDDDDDDDDEQDIPVSDLEDLDDEDKEDLIPHTRLTINNTTALLSSLNRISLPTAPFALHQSVLSSAPTADSIPDISDDLQRELAFHSQSLEAVKIARAKLRAEGVPFSRPKDYFAEMVKEDAHMEKVKAKLVEEASNKKAAAEARKLRDLKKYGKQVQVAKLQERQKAKRETLDKIKNLKRKRSENGNDLGTKEADIFDVGVEKELGKSAGSRTPGAGRGGPNAKRAKKNEKFGFGGKKRHSKSGDALSSGDISGFNPRKGGGGGRVQKGRVGKPQRPGKSRRQAQR